MTEPFRIAFVAGVTPDKWARIWRERHSDLPLELALVEEAQQRAVLVAGEADMALVRLPIDRESLHLIPLYEEQPVVVVGKEHPVAAYDEIPLAELAGEQLVAGDVASWDEVATVERLPFPEMSLKEAFEVVASGTGMAIVPMSVARLHHRKDLVHRPVLDVPTTQVGLAWPVDHDDDRVETFIGIVRGRRATSSRGTPGASEAGGRKAVPEKDTSQRRGSSKKSVSSRKTASSGKPGSGTAQGGKGRSGGRRGPAAGKRRR
ncbi:LysR family substrate-binding domain-containing protein [Nocardioides sp. JQ2195]|uniref:LysR family substrate-binding domain-containing protein n=1 Tax=Nocardioides sp. JQ2195 TaxID=2592334 RepID=UPI00143E88ED|nr:LysR family substrate-binding domain-containing protein [Nocardioides sp. JQ2195]QIX26737.1 LysR family substrate-binding domain-containing protein [Nocardioides sp. JQ2195]